MNHRIKLKTLIITLQLTFVFYFFIGIFWNPPVRMATFNEKNWYYINRGYPISWSGVSKAAATVNFPIIKAPFLTKKIYGDQYAKIIDLSIFLPLFATTFIGFYATINLVSRFIKKGKLFKNIFVPTFIFLTMLCIFFYFFWFPRI